MAFEIENFKQVGGAGNNQTGGQSYSVRSAVDNLAAMQTSGYLNGIAAKLNIGDNVILSGSDGSNLVQITSGVVPVTVV